MHAILYYSFGGSTRKLAEERAKAQCADVYEIREVRRRTLFGSFFPGAMHAMKRKSSAILPLGIDWDKYERVDLYAPVWAGYAAPAFNAALALVPAGKQMAIVLCSGGGETPQSKEGTIELVKQRGMQFISYEDFKTAVPPKASKE